MKRWLRTLLAAGLFGTLPLARADYLALEDIQNVGDGTFSYNGCFAQSSANSGSCSLAHTDALYDLSASVASYGDASGLHAWATAAISTSSAGYIVAQAQVVLTDTLTFGVSTSTPGFVSMTFTTQGTASGGNTPGFIPNVPPGTGYGASTLALDSYNQCSFYNAGNCTVLLTVDFVNPLSVSASLSANAFPSVIAGSDARFADFSHTGFISSLQFEDAGGNALALDYTSASGLTYPMAPVPEPGSLSLFCLGGLALRALTQRAARGAGR